jgi:hypothetical protein
VMDLRGMVRGLRPAPLRAPPRVGLCVMDILRKWRSTISSAELFHRVPMPLVPRSTLARVLLSNAHSIRCTEILSRYLSIRLLARHRERESMPNNS